MMRRRQSAHRLVAGSLAAGLAIAALRVPGARADEQDAERRDSLIALLMVEESAITFYFDGVELWRMKTPEEAKVPLYLMVDLAMGGGWPIDKAPSPSFMWVDHVRAYARGPR